MSLAPEDGSEITIVVETVGATAPQTITFQLDDAIVRHAAACKQLAANPGNADAEKQLLAASGDVRAAVQRLQDSGKANALAKIYSPISL